MVLLVGSVLSAHRQTGALLWTAGTTGRSPNCCRLSLVQAVLLGAGQCARACPGCPTRITGAVSTRLGCTRTPLRCDTEPTVGPSPGVPLDLLGQQRKESNTTFQLLFSSQGLCAWLDLRGHRCGISEEQQELGMLQPGGVNADGSKNVPQGITESWKGFGSKGPE